MLESILLLILRNILCFSYSTHFIKNNDLTIVTFYCHTLYNFTIYYTITAVLLIDCV